MSTATAQENTVNHPVVSSAQWLAERQALLAREKELTRLRDEITEARRALPWTRLEKDYVFDTPDGKRALADLFQGRRQLLVQHFMMGPGWPQGCPNCSFMTDHIGGMKVHLEQRDVSVMLVSRAPLAEIERFRQRMGWQVQWVSAFETDFNYDFHVSFKPEEHARGEVLYNYRVGPFPAREAPGVSLFYRGDAGEVFHTYSTFGRGVEVLMGTYNLLDLTPRGRDEESPLDWVRHHDRYEPAPVAKAATAGTCCHAEA